MAGDRIFDQERPGANPPRPRALELDEVSFSYPGQPAPALDGINLVLGDGEFCGLLGPNGAGKTTLVLLLCGVLQPDRGRVEIFGRDPRDPAGRRRFGYCPQDLALYASLTAAENLQVFGRLAGLTGRELSARIDETLDMVGLSAHDAHRVSTFSGGMKRRLNLGVALLHRPSLLLLDEPTVGVDPQSRNLIFENLLRLHRLGTTIVYTTHYMEEAERLCERHCIIDRGTILLDADRATLASYLAGHRLLVELAPDIAESVGRDLAARGLTVRAPAPDRLEVHGGEALGRVEEMARLLGPSRGEVRVLESRRLTLEDKFLELTGRTLRD